MRSEPDEWETEDEEAEEPMEETQRPQRKLPSRRSRRYRTRKSSLGFGHFMLPIVGLVAVGMLVLGVRLFFFPSPKGEVVPQTTAETQPAISPDVLSGNGGKQQQPQNETDVVAVPEGSTPVEQVAAPKKKETVTKPEAKVPLAKPEAKLTPVKSATSPVQATKPLGPQPKPLNQEKPGGVSSAQGTWGVQVGAFRERANAESLMKKLKSEGYSPRLAEAKTGEAVLLKVLVPAGKERPEADSLAKTLMEKGYPVLVVRLP